MGTPSPPQEVEELHLFMQRPWGSPRRDGNQPAAAAGNTKIPDPIPFLFKTPSTGPFLPSIQEFSLAPGGEGGRLVSVPPCIHQDGAIRCEFCCDFPRVENGLIRGFLFC